MTSSFISSRPNVLLVVVVLMKIICPSTMAFDCINPTKDPNAPSIPTITGNSYQAHLELNIVDKNKTWAIEEYLDFEGNRATRIISEGDSVSTNIYSFDTDEIFVIKDHACKVVNMSSPEAAQYLFGGGSTRIPNGGDRRHTFGAAATLRLASNGSEIYAGKATVRGISTNSWSKCTKRGPVTMETTYYFSEPDWSMPVNLQLPVRIEVEGNIPNRPPLKGLHYFHHIYDFINYRPDIETKVSVFETPKDVVCQGRLNTKTLPAISNQFQYMAENVDPVRLGVTHFSVWYDGLNHLVRLDKRDTQPQYPLYTTHPVTEIHDHNTGVRYIKDNILGNCSIYPLGTHSPDSIVDPQKTIEMSDPNRFFSFSKNYTYTGVRTVRGIQCDVYSAIIPNYKGEGIIVTAMFHYYFLSNTWEDQPLQGTSHDPTTYPLYLEIEVPNQPALSKMVNFFNFDPLEPDISVFDVSDCFDAKDKMDFRIIFPGNYDPATENEWTRRGHYVLANVMRMSPIRIGNLEMTSNLDNVFMSGSLLGTSSPAQFQLANKDTPERVMQKTFFSVNVPSQCADLCVKNTDFLCEGYQYCPGDGYSCSLSKYHVLNQTMKTNGKTCDFFTRTVANYPYPREPTVPEAYDALDKAIQAKQVHILIEKPNGFEPNYVAVAVQKLSGYSETKKPKPSMASQFSYRIETVVPRFATAFDSYVWYDSDLKVVRHDTRNAKSADATEFSTIHDFNLGISYKINKVTKECTISPIDASDDFDVNPFASKVDKKGGFQIKMKAPEEIFFMDATYTYIGQKTVRGILCDGYQSERSDYHIQALNLKMEQSLFTIYFQAEPWKYFTSESLDVTTSQPVQITIEDKTADLMMIYNVFDFDDEHHEVRYFDVSACYPPDQKKSFEIIFKNQPFHPFLDDVGPSFRDTAIYRMSEETATSPLRFQQVSLYHDKSNVYVLATVLGNVPAYTLFQPVANVTLNRTATTTTMSSYQDCAAACVEKVGFPCNSFDFCPDGQNSQCSLLLQSDEKAAKGRIDSTGMCVHYSRSELGGYPIQDVNSMYTVITNMVYDNLFSITLFKPGGPNKTYTATDIRDDILIPTDPDSAAGSMLRDFTKTPDKKLPDSAVVETHNKVMSITDCALSCKTSLKCRTFEYSYAIGTCRLSNKHLDEITAGTQQLSWAKNVNVYTVFYTKDYKQYGSVLPKSPDKSISQVTSSNLCARDCNEETSFQCESFVYCPDQKTCNLRKDHSLPANQQQAGQTLTCTFYSRQHLYDYTKLSNTIIVGHDDLITNVDSDSDCARLCANGGLEHCASFEYCDLSRGVRQCRLSLANPTIQGSNLTKQTTRECNLYTKSMTSVKPPPQKQVPSPSPKSHVTAPTQKQTSSSSSKSDDTGPRVGIAIGTLLLGTLMGAIGMLFFSKWWSARRHVTVDTHQLRDYDNQ